MSNSGYNALVIEHFERPRNVGSFRPAADVVAGAAGRREQGVEFSLSARVVGGRIAAARFEAYGCPHCLAAGSLLTESIVGLDKEALLRWQWHESAAALEAPAAKRGRFLILEDAVRAMADDWQRKF